MKKRIVSLLLAVIMLLGLVPVGLAAPQAAAAEAKPEPVVIDFKGSVKAASEQAFWADLKDSVGTSGAKLTTKFVGVQGRAAMTAAQSAAYDSLLDYLWENHGWTIDESTTYLKSGSVNKGVWLNANEMNAASDWGITYLSGGFNTGDIKANGSRLNLTVHVPQAGYYAVDVTAYYSSNAGNMMQLTNVAASAVGGAYADVLVNGTSVLPEGMVSYPFSGQAGSPKAEWVNTTQTDRLGFAYFHEGSNTLTINTTGNYMNQTASAAMRRNIGLMSMELTYVSSDVCDCSEFSYAPNGDGTHTAICTNCEAETTEDCTFSYAPNNDNTHKATCIYCKAAVDSDCADKDLDSKCDDCGGKLIANALKLKVSVPGVVEQVARGTVQQFVYSDVTAGSESIAIEDVSIRYETDVEGIIEIDADTHTFKTLANGDVTVTVYASYGESEIAKTLELTVADVGESCFLYTDPTFEADNAYLHWPTNGSGFNVLTVEDDGSGSNKALKLKTNSKADYNTNKGENTVTMKAGRLAEVWPGHMYEMTAKVKVENYERAPGAAGDLTLGFQMFDYKTNGIITANYIGKINGNNGDIPLVPGDWTEVRFIVKAPFTGVTGPAYVTPRIVLRPGAVDYAASGWEATVWFDDFCIREVGLDGVEMTVEGSVKDKINQSKVILKPVATSGDYISIPAAAVPEMLTFYSTDEEVIKVESAPTLVSGFPTAGIRRVDTSRSAELVAEMDIYGLTVEDILPVPYVDPASIVLDTMSVSIPGVEKQAARDTVQQFVFDIKDVDGQMILAEEVEITYEADVEGIVEFNEENNTFRTLQNGDVNMTVTVSLNGKSLTETIALTVADLGEERFTNSDRTFESEGLLEHWATYANYGDQRFNITTIEDDGTGTGNKALKIAVNPNVSMDDVNKLASVVTMANGYFAEVLPGHMYEMSFKVRTMDYVKAEDAVGDLGFDCQMFDYSGNSQKGTELLLQINGLNNGLPLDMTEWTEIKYVVKAPLTADGPVYMMPRVVLRPSSEEDYSLSGWQMSAWFDDFSIREVGFGHVEMEVDSMPNDTATKANVFIKSFTSNGDIIDVIADRVADAVKLYSTNDDVVTVLSVPERLVYNSAAREYHPKAAFRLVGLNAPAELVAEVTLCGITHTASLDMTRTDMPEELRDIDFTLDGFKALVLNNGESAKSAMTGRTTQLNPLTEEQLRHGSVYFTSSNTEVAVVDPVSGDVTCVGEGTATISAYVMLDGVTAGSSVELTVTDETDLHSIEIYTAVDYVGVGNAVQLSVRGKKASGGVADMSLYPMAWSVDKTELAYVSQTGRVSAFATGTIEVTATVGVEGRAVTDTITLKIVPNSELAATDVVLNFTNGHLMNVHECTIEKDGVQINRAETYNEGVDAKTIHKYGFGFNVPAGEQLAIDFVVPRDGWYRVEAGGGLFSSGNISSIYVDEHYAGDIDFFAGISGQPYMASLIGNTIYLEAGVHTFYVVAVTDGLQFLGRLVLRAAADPAPVAVEVSVPKQSILVGEELDLTVAATDVAGKTFHLKYQEEETGINNYYIMAPVDDTVVLEEGMIVGAEPGHAMVDVTVSVNGTVSYHTVEFDVEEGTVASVALTADKTTFKPNGGSAQLAVVCYNIAGKKTEAPADLTVSYETSDPEVATVSADGTVTAGGKEGSAKITATVAEGSHVMEAALWITITTGKAEPTLFTYEERANAQENALKYTWAWDTKEAAVTLAEFVIENFDLYYGGFDREGLPRTSAMYHEGYNGLKDCDYCGMAIEEIFGVNCWIVDPINKPWKVTCPYCKKDFPSNDFESYYESGLDDRGYFDAERADKSLLVNTTFPDRPDDWGVDDGHGWLTGDKDSGGKPDQYNYIAYYNHMRFTPRGKATNGLLDGIEALANAYMYTGEEKYGTYGAILLTRVAEIYPEYSMLESSPSGTYVNSDGGSGRGKFAGAIWEATMVGQKLAKASDALWPAMNHDAVIEFLRDDAYFYGVEPEVFTPEYLREKVDTGILLQIRDAVLSTDAAGNFGMEQGAMAMAAVALDRMPETEEMLDWTFRYGQRLAAPTAHATGGNVYYNVVNLVDRNGFGNEVSYTYNRQWYTNLMGVADALAGYTRVEGADLWKFPKFVEMFRAFGRLVQGGHAIVQFGECGSVQNGGGIIDLDAQNYFVPAFQNTGDPFLAKMIYAGNGNSVDGLHADIFTKDPESGLRSKIQTAINTYGEMDMGASSLLAGYGVANLRKGPAKFLGVHKNGDAYFNTAMFFGSTDASHGHLEALSLNIFAFGLSMTANLGYPTVVSSNNFECTQWVRNSISHNLVLVNDEQQTTATYGGYPLHFDDAGVVQLADVDASNAYPETDIYRRTVVTVEAPNGVPYNVDFFRVLGGSEHVYSFHANADKDPATEGLDFLYQPMGSYAGADVPYGPRYHHPTSTDGSYNQGNGYSWLKEVYRDADPDSSFTVDWAIEDFNSQLSTSDGIHMRLTMLSEEPMTEVALADGIPPQNGKNPEKLKYMLVRRSGEKGMDTLFTSVIETYRINDQIASSELVDMTLIEGTASVTDKAAAVKVTMRDGRVDYIVYATDPDHLYEVDGKFEFSGFVGVCSYYGERLVYAYGNEATKVAHVVEDAVPAITGEIVRFTEGLSLDGYTITVSTEQDVTKGDFEGRCIYVTNDGQRNAVYQIQGAEVVGDTVILDIGHETLVRGYLDGTDLDAGFLYNIAVGADYTIPLSSTFNFTDIFQTTFDQVVKVGNKMSITTGVAGSGATYEIEGLATGMKFNAKNGQIDWTTSRTQIGRYPITVRAIDADGTELGEMDFTIYVVNYTGSSYAPEQCAHSKAVTYDVSGVVETVCPACGTVTKTAKEEDPDVTEKILFAGSNMTLGNELEQNFMVVTSDLKDGYKALITHNGKTVEAAFSKYNKTYSCVSYSVAAKEMTDAIEVVVVDAEGNAVSEVYTSSVRDYAMKALTAASSTSKVKTMVVDMLNYGAAAQTYFGYKTEDLANAKLTEVQKSWATGEVACTDRRVKGSNYYGSNLSLEDKILLNLYFTNCTEGMTAKIGFTDYTGKTVEADAKLVQYAGKIYKVEVDEVVLADAFSDVTVNVFDGETVHGTATDSVESYVARSEGSDLYVSIIKFATSAKAYFA